MSDLFIGVLSGTSMDAIDVALVKIDDNNKPKLVHAKNFPLPEVYTNKCRLLAAGSSCSLEDLGQLDHQAGKLFANAINVFLTENKIDNREISAIGSHGQTIKHSPNAEYPFTLQIGDPNVISHYTSIPVVADFRRRDIVAGGQGAPLAPILHQTLFQSNTIDRIIVNIGGISNATILPKDSNVRIKGFDTGPGNCLMDFWVNKYFNKSFDENGVLAASGDINKDLLTAMLADPFFKLTPPKSTGTDYFNLKWLDNLLATKKLNYSNSDKQILIDILTTLCHLTAQSIANDLNKENFSKAEVYVCGGGTHNKFLFNLIQKFCRFDVKTTNDINLHPDWLEAMLFAMLAKKRFYKESLNLGSITGAKHEVILGGVYQ